MTGATSAVVWILHQQAAAQGGRRVVQFSTVRLTEHQAKVAESALARTLLAKAGHLVEGADFRSTSTHTSSELLGFLNYQQIQAQLGKFRQNGQNLAKF